MLKTALGGSSLCVNSGDSIMIRTIGQEYVLALGVLASRESPRRAPSLGMEGGRVFFLGNESVSQVSLKVN